MMYLHTSQRLPAVTVRPRHANSAILKDEYEEVNETSHRLLEGKEQLP